MDEKEKKATEYENVNLVDKVLSSKVAFAMMIISATFWLLTNAYSNFIKPSSDNSQAIALLTKQVEDQNTRNDALTKTLQNDTQELKLNVQNLTDSITDLKVSVAELTTKIDERIPKKK